MTTEIEYITILDNGNHVYRCILSSDIHFEPIEYNNEEQFKSYIITLANKYSALSWNSFLTNILAFIGQKNNPHELCILFAFININIKNIMIDIDDYKLFYLIEFYNVSKKINSEVHTRQLDKFIDTTLIDFTQESIDIIGQIIWELDDIDILEYKSKVAIDKANKFKYTSLYNELVAISYYDLNRMRHNGLIDFIYD